MSTRAVTHAPSWSSPGNTGQLPFGFSIPERNAVARLYSLLNVRPKAMQARAVGSKAVCDDGDRAAQPPLDNCFCANSARRLWTATSLVVTMALLYCRLLILSNFGRKTLCHQAHPPSPRNRSRSFARANERAYRISRRELSPPKTRMAEISWRVLTRCDYG